MPKKTREEKIIARLRRLENSQKVRVENEQQVDPINELPKISFDLKTEGTFSVAQPSKVWDYSHVYRDLSKSLIFAAVAVIFQIILAVFFFN